MHSEILKIWSLIFYDPWGLLGPDAKGDELTAEEGEESWDSDTNGNAAGDIKEVKGGEEMSETVEAKVCLVALYVCEHYKLRHSHCCYCY